jgi:hypothetical protein
LSATAEASLFPPNSDAAGVEFPWDGAVMPPPKRDADVGAAEDVAGFAPKSDGLWLG